MIFFCFKSPPRWMVIALMGVLLPPVDAFAQITTDQTSQTTVQFIPSSNTTQITGGRSVQGNLFHSFRDFSISQQSKARFVLGAKTPIRTIFARVTGPKVSDINGTLLVDGNANLILMNPNGIQFSHAARLNLGGGFLGTTADSIGFENGQVFSAKNPEDTALLMVKTPVGIQFGQNPGEILVGRDPNAITSSPNLKLLNNQHFSLLGGSVRWGRRKVLVPNGIITIAAIGANQTVPFNLSTPNNLFNQFEGVQKFDELDFDTAEINTRFQKQLPKRLTQGKIQLFGNNLTLNNKVRIRSDVGAQIKLQLTGDLTLLDGSRINTNTNTNLLSNLPENLAAPLKAGDINIQALNLVLRDGSQIKASAEGDSLGGNISLQIRDRIFISDISERSRLSSAILSDGFKGGSGGNIVIQAPGIELQEGGLIRSRVFNQGKAGKITIQAHQLSILNGSQISTSATGKLTNGRSGTLDISVRDQIQLSGTTVPPRNLNIAAPPEERAAAILAESLGDGPAGTINLQTQRLSLGNGAEISNTTVGTNNPADSAGILQLNVNQIELIGNDAQILSETRGLSPAGNIIIRSQETSPLSITLAETSRISASSTAAAQGASGKILIQSPTSVLVEGQGNIAAETSGRGVGGPIEIESPIIQVRQATITNQTSNTALAGDINLMGDRLQVSDGGQISSSATNAAVSGQSGNLNVVARESIIIAGEETAVKAEALGDGRAGDIRLMTPWLTLNDGGQISNTVVGRTQAAIAPSQINLDVNTLSLKGERSEIKSETQGLSPAGSIRIRPQDHHPLAIRLDRGSQISVSSTPGARGRSGVISVEGTPSIALSGAGKIAAETRGTSPGGLITLDSPVIDIHESAITSQSFGSARAGDIALTGNVLALRDRAALTTSSAQSTGGNIQLNIQDLVFLTNGSAITAAAQGNGGNISSLVPTQPWLLAPPNNRVTIDASSLQNQGGNIDLNQFRVLGFAIASNQEPLSGPINQISASGRTPALSGQINAELITNLLPNDLLVPPMIAVDRIAQPCHPVSATSDRSTLQLIGRGGRAVRDAELSQLWDDARAPFQMTQRHPPVAMPVDHVPLREAHGWIRQDSGQIRLLASVNETSAKLWASECYASNG